MLIYSIEDDNQLQTIKCKVSVEYISIDTNKNSLFEIDRISKVLVNNIPTDTIVDTLAEEVSNTLYPLQIVVNKKGQWLGVHNYNDIFKRWTIKRKQILERNEGLTIKKFLTSLDSIFDNPKNLLINLSDDWFLNVYFSGIHTNYTSNLSFSTQVDFAIIPKEKPVTFIITQTIDEYLNDSNIVVITKKGYLASTSKENNLEKSNSSGNYNALYHLNPNTYVIENASIECHFTNNSLRKTSIKIYNLNEKKIITSDQKHFFFIGETKKKRKLF